MSANIIWLHGCIYGFLHRQGREYAFVLVGSGGQLQSWWFWPYQQLESAKSCTVTAADGCRSACSWDGPLKPSASAARRMHLTLCDQVLALLDGAHVCAVRASCEEAERISDLQSAALLQATGICQPRVTCVDWMRSDLGMFQVTLIAPGCCEFWARQPGALSSATSLSPCRACPPSVPCSSRRRVQILGQHGRMVKARQERALHTNMTRPGRSWPPPFCLSDSCSEAGKPDGSLLPQQHSSLFLGPAMAQA